MNLSIKPWTWMLCYDKKLNSNITFYYSPYVFCIAVGKDEVDLCATTNNKKLVSELFRLLQAWISTYHSCVFIVSAVVCANPSMLTVQESFLCPLTLHIIQNNLQARPLPKLSVLGSLKCMLEPKLPANHYGILGVPEIVTNGPPFPISVYFHPSPIPPTLFITDQSHCSVLVLALPASTLPLPGCPEGLGCSWGEWCGGDLLILLSKDVQQLLKPVFWASVRRFLWIWESGILCWNMDS